jgi:integrase
VADEPAAQLTLSELVRAYASVRADGTDLRLKKWIHAFGNRMVWSITSEELELAAQAMREHGYSPATANRDLSALGSVYRWAKERRISPRGFKSPTVGVRRHEEPIRRVHLERDDAEDIRAMALSFADRRFGAFVWLLMDTGARKSELLERRWSEVDLERREILAPITKNGTPRVLFFSERTQQLLRRVFPVRNPNQLLFEGRVPGQSIDFRASWRKLLAALGQHGLRIHDCRHVAAANLLRAGVTLGVAAQVLGHDPAVLSRRYGHLENASLKTAQEAAWR